MADDSSILSKYYIQTARYTSESHDNIEVTLEKEDGEIFIHNVPVHNPENADLVYLLANDWDYERIQEATTDWVRAEAAALKQMYRYLAQEEVKRLEEKYQAQFEILKQAELEKSNIIAAIVENNEDEEAVFRAKLAVFELESIKKSKAKTLKTNIRKAATLVELISLIKDKI